MSFLDNIKRREQENYRISAWSQSVRQLYRFIRQYLRRAETESSLTVKADLLRLDNVFFDRITMFFNGETVTVTPLALTDSRTPEEGGCIVIQSTNRVTYNLLWDGKSATLPGENHWKLVRVDDHARPNILQIDRLTVSCDAHAGDVETLSETSFDEALNMLFGLADRTEPPSREITRHPSLFKPVGAFAPARKSVEYSDKRSSVK
jgi:hypothetical protein